MTPFPEFEEMYGAPAECEQPPETELQRYEGELPEQLLELWRKVGRCAYGDGLLWLADPEQFRDIIDDWVDFDPARTHVFLRSAFAHLYLWHDGFVHSLDVQRGDLSQVTEDITLMFLLLCDDEIRERTLQASLFEEVKQRLGPPARDECYAFVPALALGGPGTAESVQKVKIREQLGILAEIVGS